MSGKLFGVFPAFFDLCKLAEIAGAGYVARWTTAHPKQVIKSIMRGLRKRGTAFIEILSQCPVHEKTSPVTLLKRFKKDTIHISKAKGPTDGKTLIGEFCDIARREWNKSYQEVIDQFVVENRKIDE